MLVLTNENTVFCDVDDTLVLWHREDPDLVLDGYALKKNQNVIDMIIAAKKSGKATIVWSLGGASWAAKVVRAIGLEGYVDLIITKPIKFIDDLQAKEFMSEEQRIIP